MQNVKAAEARRDGAIARYQETVLQALEETENALAGFRTANRSGRRTARRRRRRVGSRAPRAHALRRRRERLPVGAGSPSARRLDLEDQHVQAATRRATALAALYKALAGDL